jgi:hypothetical protein
MSRLGRVKAGIAQEWSTSVALEHGRTPQKSRPALAEVLLQFLVNALIT